MPPLTFAGAATKLRAARARPRGRGRRDQRGVALVAAHDPRARVLGRLAELDVALDQPLDPQLLVGLDVPGLVEQRPDARPAASPTQQVVALGDDQRDLARDGDRARDRLLDLAPELGRVDDRRRSSRAGAGAARRSRRRRTCPARPSGRAARAARARTARGGSRPSARAARASPSSATTARATVDLPPPGGPAMPRTARRPSSASRRARASAASRWSRISIMRIIAPRGRASCAAVCAPS